MLEQARNYIAPGDRSRVHFIQSGAEEIPAIPDASVDLVTAGQFVRPFPQPLNDIIQFQRKRVTGLSILEYGKRFLAS